MRLKKTFIMIGLLMVITGCAQQQVKHDSAQSTGYHYGVGMEEIRRSRFTTAINEFKTQIKRYPDAPETEKATLQLIYTYYKQKQLNDSISIAEKYIEKYPISKKLDYAYYSKGLALFDLGLAQDSKNSSSANKIIRQAYQNFSALVKRFPESKYAYDSVQRMTFLRDKLTENDVGRARMALSDKKYEEAVVYARYIIENYKGTPAAVEALDILTQSYNFLGLNGNSDTRIQLTETAVVEKASIVAPEVEDSEIDPVGWGNAAWFHAQSNSDYTFQLFMTPDEEEVIKMIGQYDLFSSGNYVYYPVEYGGGIWYILLYGTFPTISMAENAINSLPPGLVKNRPWIRRIGTHKKISERGSY